MIDESDFTEEDVTTEDSELLKRVKRIETGIEEIYKLLAAQKPVATQTDKVCGEHGEAMSSAVSRKTNKPYAFHKNDQGQICFGRGFQG